MKIFIKNHHLVFIRFSSDRTVADVTLQRKLAFFVFLFLVLKKNDVLLLLRLNAGLCPERPTGAVCLDLSRFGEA